MSTPKEPATPTGTSQGTPPETPQATPTGKKPPAKPKIKITKNENGTFRVDDLQFKINSMNDSTITLTSGDKKYKIGKKNNTYTIDGATFQIQSSNMKTQPNGSIMVNVQLAPSVKQALKNNQMNTQQRANIDKHIGTREVQQQGVHWHLIGKDMAWNTEFGNLINSKIQELQSVQDPTQRNALFQKIKELNPSEKDTLWNLYLGYQFKNPSGRKNLPPSPTSPKEVKDRLTGMAPSVQEKYIKNFNTFVDTYRLAIEAEYNKLKYQNQFPQQMSNYSAPSIPIPHGYVTELSGGKKRASRKMRPSKMSRRKRLKTRRVK